jgi:hypothetical protein
VKLAAVLSQSPSRSDSLEAISKLIPTGKRLPRGSISQPFLQINLDICLLSQQLLANNMATSSTIDQSSPWHAAYPAPRSISATIRREDVLDMLKQGLETSSRDYVLIDLRRTDYEVSLVTHL